MELTVAGARALLLAAQGLLVDPDAAATKESVRAAIQRMGVLQIDTISVVARSSYLVLWSRLGTYERAWLDELLAEGALFECWAHEACFVPIEDYPAHRQRMFSTDQAPLRRHRQWLIDHPVEAARFLDHIRETGPVRSADFARTDGRASGWWDWKPEKYALERLFGAGELMIARRQNFARVYDLRERVHPTWDDSLLPGASTAWEHFVTASVRALGVTPRAWVADYYRISQATARRAMEALLERGELVEASIEGWTERGLVHRDNLELARAAAAGALVPTATTLLSPFDPIVWDRARALRLFDFDYRIECYTPAPQRRYGYFTLPILHRGVIVGRLDPKAHRRDGVFEVKAVHLEPGVRVTEELVSKLGRALRDCAEWHGTPEVKVAAANVRGLAAKLERAAKPKRREAVRGGR